MFPGLFENICSALFDETRGILVLLKECKEFFIVYNFTLTTFALNIVMSIYYDIHYVWNVFNIKVELTANTRATVKYTSAYQVKLATSE
jgi:hypothetical protein